MTSYLAEQFGYLQTELANGACRALALDDSELTDSQGHPSSGYAPRTPGFLPCSWTAKKIEEKFVSDRTRSLAGYEITLPQKQGGVQTVFKPSDRLELKLKPNDASAVELEILAVLNQSNVAWTIYAIDLEADR